ncbi:PP2C family protein-serine/threonine phosphatase [Actinomadura livida]|uniref:PP2C family protein-serine/threonine phosphatase n=1 Tax=Actinomadura livida TaxID=79909 RepID=A0A7W7I7X0_9ACTN|nr:MULTISPECIES: PP2C family protein-serine/threonine phosphatase [Actinomadura]MBB4772135.1 serine phosphatase RsbU (regulator of sigma subunit) [Actinomadura catellatispora]GGU37553.1 phosphatase [Actinomadura livida]
MHDEPGNRDFAAIAGALWAAAPHELIDVAVRLVERHAHGTCAEVLLVDYRQAYLVRTAPGRAELSVDNTAPGRAFASQRIVREPPDPDGGRVLHLPLTVQGERLGVLSVRLPAGEPPWLAEFAGTAARALKIANQATDLFRRLRRRGRLTVAAEMQWDLLPAPSFDSGEFRFAGQLEPAYAVWGDNFDWAASEDRLTLTVSNGMGSGTEAAALTNLAISALRNARRSGDGITEQAALADQTLFARHRGERHMETLLLEFELATGLVRVVDAGSPIILRMRGNAIDSIGFDAQMPLGMFGDTGYVTEEFTAEPGDRLVVVSDGVNDALSPAGERYGEHALARALRRTRLQDPPEAARTMIRHFLDHHGDGEPADDAVIVCVDWTGRDG